MGVRYLCFVDSSNLMGTFRHLDVRVQDYEKYFKYVFQKAVDVWRTAFYANSIPPVELRRVLWYTVGTIDDWNLDDPKAQAHLKEQFDSDRDFKRLYMAAAGQKLPGASQDKVALEAWSLCFNEFRVWYEKKRESLAGMGRFHHALRRDTDLIDVIDTGHWKVDLFHKTVSEKGVDTSLAVDMVALIDNYDVAVLLSGDADNIPSVRFVKSRNKSVGVVEFLKGYPPEKRGKNASSLLKLEADFVVQLYEMDMIPAGVAQKGQSSSLPEGTAFEA